MQGVSDVEPLGGRKQAADGGEITYDRIEILTLRGSRLVGV